MSRWRSKQARFCQKAMSKPAKTQHLPVHLVESKKVPLLNLPTTCVLVERAIPIDFGGQKYGIAPDLTAAPHIIFLKTFFYPLFEIKSCTIFAAF